MRKNLLLAFAFGVSLSTWAQTSFDTAQTLQNGQNSYGAAESAVTAYWKYTPEEDVIAQLKPSGNFNTLQVKTIVPNAETQKNDTITLTSAQLKYPNCAFAFEKAKTYYVVMDGYASYGSSENVTLTFEAVISNNVAGIGTGLTEDNPLVFVSGKEQMLGSHYVNGYQSTYATYTATEDGLLVLETPSYVSSSQVNGANLLFDYTSTSYRAVLPVKEGETLNFTFSNYGPLYFTPSLTHPVLGSYDNPFELKTGANSVPAEAGEYWYSVVPETTGFFTIQSENALPQGNVELFMGKTAYASATSATGSYNLRYEIAYVSGYTYYVKVNKAEATAEPDVFEFALEGYKPGEKADNPLIVETVPSEYTIPVQSTYYLKVSVPEGTEGFLVAEVAGGAKSEETYLNVYPGSESWYGVRGSSIVKYAIQAPNDYMIECRNREEGPLTLNVYYAAIEPGDVITSPLKAVLGENTISGKGTKYYTYKATKDAKVLLTAPENITVSFTTSVDEYPLLDNYKNGTVNTLYATANTTYYIKLEGVADADVFTIAEADYVAGDTKALAIAVENGIYTFGNEVPVNLWVKYTVSKSGKLTISSDVPCDYQSVTMTYWRETSSRGNTMISYDDNYNMYFAETFDVNEGENIYVNIVSKNGSSYAGNVITFEESEPAPGESPLTAIDGTSEAVNVPATGYDKSYWVMVTAAAEGKIVIKANNPVSGYVYIGLDKALEGDGYLYFGTQYNEADGYVAEVPVVQTGTYYFKFSYTYSDAVVTFEGDAVATAISEVEANTIGAAEAIYDVRGIKHTAADMKKGLYIIKKNGKTQKVVVK